MYDEESIQEAARRLFYSEEEISSYYNDAAKIDCPAKIPCRRGTVRGMIVHLNDTHAWSKLQIADWLDAMEAEGWIKQDVQQ